MILNAYQIKTIADYPLYGHLKVVRGDLFKYDELSQGRIHQLLLKLQHAQAARLLFSSPNLAIYKLLSRLINTLDNESDLERFRPLVNAVVANSPDTDVWAAVLDLVEAVKLPVSSRILNVEQIKIIAEHPLDNFPDRLRTRLLETTGGPSSGDVAYLLILLTYCWASCCLCSSNFTLLQLLDELVPQPGSSLEKFRPLINAVVANSPDTDIWAAVLDLVELPRLPYHFHHRVTEDELLSEVEHCTFRNVGGFWNKYFNPETWQQTQKDIFDQMLQGHSDNAWGFPAFPDHDSVWNWLRQLETRFLAGVPNKLSTIDDLNPPEGHMDVFIQLAANQAIQSLVLVVGAIKESYDPGDFQENFLRLVYLVQGVFYNQPTCRFVHAFSLRASTMELWVFDRSGSYSSGAFNICHEPEKFARALVGYATMDSNALGRDLFIETTEGNCQVTLYDADSSSTNKETTVGLIKRIVKKTGLFNNGTTCYTAENNYVAKFSWASAKQKLELEHLRLAEKRGVKGVAKLVAYRQITTIAELRAGLRFPKAYLFGDIETTDLELSSSAAGSTNTPGFKRKLSDDALDSMSNHKRQRLDDGKSDLTQTFSDQLSSDQTKPGLDTTGEELWEDRSLICSVISPAGRVISDFESIKELLESMQDAIKAHQSLYTVGGILHGDISDGNIIITKPEIADGFKGMLIDLDLAKVLDSGAPLEWIGTRQFVAIQVLRKVDHTYRHDLESFFYVLVWMCARTSWTKTRFKNRNVTPPYVSQLDYWEMGYSQRASMIKERHMRFDGFQSILREFPPAFEVVKPLCLSIRKILFPVGEDGELFLGTPDNHEELYEPIIKAYDEAIGELS